MITPELIGQIATALSVIVSSIAMGANLFDIIVNEVNLIKGFPNSVEYVRKYWAYRNPGDFYKIITPLYVLVTLVALAVFWDVTYERRYLLLGALLAYGATQAITVIYFFPQNAILREGRLEEVEKLFTQFATTRLYLDLLRNLLTLTASVLALVALTRPLP
ncbi:hypothetical protein ACFSUS_27540 [Spirosoma soli]|uniref:DUF1772 domain-containing protein n=1 Tax=Spirosoma soli TaxID=1770529 RepID=A0ABW5MCL1_9BACT